MELRGWEIAVAGIENFILFNTAFSVVAFALAYLLRRSNWLTSWHPLTKVRLYILTLALPPIASAWLVCAALFPALWLGEEMWGREHADKHSLHLLNAFTVVADPLLGYMAMAFALLALVAASWAAWRAYFHINRLVECLEIGAAPASAESISVVETFGHRYGIAVGLVVSNYPFSFVWGYFKSKLLVSTGLLNALTAAELVAVLEHEAAHHTRRDNLLKWALTICRFATPAFLLTGLVYRWLNEQIELVCDELAVRGAASPLDLAEALVRLKRLTLAAGGRTPQLAGSGFFDDGRASFEQRVTRALALEAAPLQPKAETMSRSCVRAALAGCLLFTCSLGVLFMTSPLAIHRAVESVLQITQR